MTDVIIAFLAAEGAPALVLLLKMRQVGLQGDAGVVAALTALGQGSVLGGLGCLLAVQLLAIPAAMGCILLFYHWKYRKVYDSSEATSDTVEALKELPLSGTMKRIVFHHVIHEFMRHVHARARENRKRNRLT